MMFKSILAGALTALTMLGTTANGQQACGAYTVQAGDTLGDIAYSAYGNGDYQVLYNANRDVLNANPAALEPGLQLSIPCPDGRIGHTENRPAPKLKLGSNRDLATLATTVLPTDGLTSAFQPEIRFLTGGDYAPFTGQDLPEDGMFTELVRSSMSLSGTNREYSVTFVNDWSLHLPDLLPTGAFDMGFPWFMPNCEYASRLSPAMQDRCRDYHFSSPFYEAVIGYYTKPGNAFEDASRHQDLFGAKICRPDGYYKFDLDQANLQAPNAEIFQPLTTSDCFAALQAGDVDVVSMNIQISSEVITDMGLRRQVRELSRLATVQTLHILSHRANPYGRAYLSLLNRGLRQMRDNGEWFTIVSRHLANHASRTAAN